MFANILRSYARIIQTMNTNTQIEKIDKVLSKISGKELKAFAHLYACTHDDFATALVEKLEAGAW